MWVSTHVQVLLFRPMGRFRYAVVELASDAAAKKLHEELPKKDKIENDPCVVLWTILLKESFRFFPLLISH